MKQAKGTSLEALALAVAAWTLVLLQLEVWVWRPGYAGGDETRQIAAILGRLEEGGFQWLWGQGSLYRFCLTSAAALSAKSLGVLHSVALGFFVAELILLHQVAKRWWGRSAAAWTVLALCLSANTWLRARGLLTFQWVPFLLAALAFASRYVTGWRSALGWGLGLGLAATEYEGAALAAPCLLAVCASQEEGLAKGLWWAAAAALGLLALCFWLQPGHGLAYAAIRYKVSVQGRQGSEALASVLANWKGLCLGGEPRPYMAVGHWPAWPPWLWLGLGLGLVQFWRQRAWAWLLWALCLPLFLVASKSPHGLPSQRLVAALPALALASGLGLSQLSGGSFRWRSALLLVFLGLATEGYAWSRHLAKNQAFTWGRSQGLAMAQEALERSCRPQDAVLTAWAGLHSPDLAWHFNASLPDHAQRAWFLAPLPLRRALHDAPGQRVFLPSKGSEPTWLILAEGPLKERLVALERALKPLAAPGTSLEQRRQWLREHGPKTDPWLWAAVLEASRGPLAPGPEAPKEYYRWAQRALPVSPSPMVWLGKLYVEDQPQYALELASQALALHPDYTPALYMRVQALEGLGRAGEASRARAEWEERSRQGAWQVYDRP